jgi:hypothetical protein
MNMNKERKSKAARAYEAISAAAGKIETLSETELTRLARAVNPDLRDFDLDVSIFDFHWWIDQDIADGTIDRLNKEFLSSLYRMKRRLTYFREELRSYSCGKIQREVALVLEFSWRDVRIWIDCETGRLWNLGGRNTKYCSAERRQELKEIDNEANRLIAAELVKIWKERTERIEWIDQGMDYSREARTEILSLQRRRNPKAEWNTVRTFATRYYPAGSALYDKEEQEAYRLKYLREQGDPSLMAKYPEHQPDHYTIQEAV